PHEAVYGKPPPTIQSYIPGTSAVDVVNTTLQDRDTILHQLRLNLQATICNPQHPELSTRYYGPFQVLSRVGLAAYKLQMPGNSKLHNVFHVSLLKKKVGAHVTSSPTLPPLSAEVVAWVPAKVLNMGIFKRQNKPVARWLIQWEAFLKRMQPRKMLQFSNIIFHLFN
ncbi:unnamed protein product, partial [Prunus brigantina]